jgi:hypothetical protein
MNLLERNEAIVCNTSKKANYVAPRIETKSVMVEDGFGTSHFNNHPGMTEQMHVVNWN